MADDDELPLSALQKPPKILKNVDDSQSLASLVSPGGAKPAAKPGGAGAARPMRPKAAAPAPSPQGGSTQGKGNSKGKGAGANKRKASSSSDSSTGSDSSSSESEAGGPAKKRPMKAIAKFAQKAKLIQRSQPGNADEDEEFDHGGAVKGKDRTTKEKAVAALLCRWWYMPNLPDWPPQEDDWYAEKLKERKLKKVRIEEWEWLPDVDKEGRIKVYELSQFKGMFRDPKDKLHDLRPMESCPCYKNYMSWDIVKLYGGVVAAYEGQLKELKTSKYNEQLLTHSLQSQLNSWKKKLNDAMAMDTSKRNSVGNSTAAVGA